MAYTETAPELFKRLGGMPLNEMFAGIHGKFAVEIEPNQKKGVTGGTWVVDVDNNEVKLGDPAGCKVLLKAQELDFMALVEGRMSAEDGVLTERLSVAGDMAVVSQLMGAFDKLREAGALG